VTSAVTSAATIKPGRVFAVIVAGTTIFAIAQTAINPAVPAIARDLKVSPASATWVFTGFLLASAVMTPVMGRLGDMFGRRRLLIVSLSGFSAGSLVTALAPNLALMIAGRVIAGIGGGIISLSFSIVGSVYAGPRRPTMLGIISALNGAGAGIGLIFGGLVIDHWSYRGIFWAGSVLGAGVAVFAAKVLPKREIPVTSKVDFVGVALLASGLTITLLGVSEASSRGWGDPLILGMFAVGFVVLLGFGWYETRRAAPLVNVAMLSHRPMLLTNLIIFQVGASVFAVLILVPRMAQTPSIAGYGFGMTATRSALVVVPGALTLLLTGTIAGILTRRFGPRVPAIVGAVIAACGLSLLAAFHGELVAVIGYSTLAFFGLGMQSATSPNLVLSYAPRSMAGEASGVNALIRAIGSSVGAQLTATILAGTVIASTGFATSAGYRTCFAITATFALLAAIMAYNLPRVAVAYRVPLVENVGAGAAIGDEIVPVDGTLPERS
jgi:EmrB/QacA subfamily drug resistance transporter